MLYDELLKITKNVSRETFEKLKNYHEYLLKWQKTHNIISNSTLKESWKRHFLDSAQLTNYLDEKNSKLIIDLGSGAGFPGAVVSILKNIPVYLVESNYKKTIFLKEIKSLTEARFEIIESRIEKIKTLSASLIISRALTSLNELMYYSSPFLLERGECLFLKGKSAEREIEEAKKNWNFEYEKIISLTDCQSFILRVKQIERKNKGFK